MLSSTEARKLCYQLLEKEFVLMKVCILFSFFPIKYCFTDFNNLQLNQLGKFIVFFKYLLILTFL